MAFKCTVVTPETQMFDEIVSSAVLPAHDGQVGILTDHAPVLMKLGSGPLVLQKQGGTTRFFISGGVAQMKDNKLTILTDEAVAPEKLDIESARKELETPAGEPLNAAAAELRRKRRDRAQALIRMGGA
jgi:F-type H+-transporting ATPase subunit epsilon